MRYDAEHKAKTRALVLKEAGRAIRAEGPDRLGVAAIMSRAGLTHGGFYAHFESKDALVAEAVAEAFSDGHRMFERSTRSPSANGALAGYITNYLSPRHRDAPALGCPLPALAGDLSRLPHTSREGFGRGVADLTNRIAALLEAAGIADPPATAASVLSEMVGALALSRAVPDPAESERVLASSRNSLFNRLGLKDAEP